MSVIKAATQTNVATMQEVAVTVLRAVISNQASKLKSATGSATASAITKNVPSTGKIAILKSALRRMGRSATTQ